MNTKPLRIGLLGLGTVGSGTFAVLRENASEIERRVGFPIEITAIASRNVAKIRELAGTERLCRVPTPWMWPPAQDVDVAGRAYRWRTPLPSEAVL
ncbi:MAG: hypothetical protein HC848_10640, partial [Limnobacter sp.]|nr:hypothetical protein [Limnobacter sp.]